MLTPTASSSSTLPSRWRMRSLSDHVARSPQRETGPRRPDYIAFSTGRNRCGQMRGCGSGKLEMYSPNTNTLMIVRSEDDEDGGSGMVDAGQASNVRLL
jgi:hypothetical protein